MPTWAWILVVIAALLGGAIFTIWLFAKAIPNPRIDAAKRKAGQ